MTDPVHAFKADGTASPGAGIALGTKANKTHTHPTTDIDGLADALALLTYDSGERDWSASLVEGWSGAVSARRMGRTVFVLFNGITAAEGAGSTIFSFPTGFRPVSVSSSAVVERILLHSTVNPPAVRRVYFNDRAIINGVVLGEALYGAVTYLTADPIPA